LTQAGRVLVTGANGHLGRRLLVRLAGRRPARAVVRSGRAARVLAEDVNVETRVLDYADAAALAEAAQDCSHAIHLVGIIKEGAGSSYERAHEDATRALVQAAEAAGLQRIVYMSILGSSPAATNPCLASKGSAEAMLLAAKTPALVLRVPMVLGEGDFASRALRSQAMAPVVFQTRGGASLEQPIYAGDVVEALIAGVTLPDLDDVSLDLAGPESLSHRKLVARAAALLGRSPRVIPLPLSLVKAAAGLMERVSKNPALTRAMLGVLDHDDDVDTSDSCRRLGLELTSLDETLKLCVGAESTGGSGGPKNP
jgi:uncharacterized protein YbjT (DUF2867 family)